MKWLQNRKRKQNEKKENVIGSAINKNGEVVFYVSEKKVESALAKSAVVDKQLDGKRTRVEEREMPKACVKIKATGSTIYKTRTRPYQPGQSISSVRGMGLHAGTLGLIGARATYKWGSVYLPEWVGRLFSAKFLLKAGIEVKEVPVGITNRHVAGEIGNQVVQPGTLDGGRIPFDLIGEVVAHGEFDNNNPLDISVFEIIENNYKTWPLNMRMDKIIVEVAPGFGLLKKSGRTSAVSYGMLSAKDVTIPVDMGEHGVIQFKGIYEVDWKNNTPLLQPGDSGSSVWTSDNKLVGIGFAASSRYSYVIPIGRVIEEFGVTL